MKSEKAFRTSALYLAISLTACSPHVNDHSGKTDLRERTSIVGGTSVTKRDAAARSVVALVGENVQGEALCTGSVISDEIILTAAHCLTGVSRLFVIFSTNLKTATRADVHLVDQAVQHPRWSGGFSSDRGDLALLHFTGGLPVGYKPAVLADVGFRVEPGSPVLFLGYGVQNGRRNSGSGRLRETESTIFGRVSQTEIVTDGQKSSVCFGDSGGPAFENSGTALIQWGIASSVTNRACNTASIHTLISPYRNWIRETAARLSARRG